VSAAHKLALPRQSTGNGTRASRNSEGIATGAGRASPAGAPAPGLGSPLARFWRPRDALPFAHL